MLWIDTNSIAVHISIFLKSRLPPGSQVKKVIHVANTNMISNTHMEFVALAVINKHNSRFTAKQQCIFVIKSFKKESDYGKLDLQSVGSSPNLTYTKISALDAIRIL